MKKLSLLVLILAVFLMGCELDAFKYYQEASEKSDTILKGQSELSLDIQLKLKDQVLVENDGLDDMIGHIRYSNQTQFDEGDVISRQYIGNDTFGLDTVYYKNDNQEFIKIPFWGKYVSLADLMAMNMDTSAYEEPPINEASVEAIKVLWQDLVKADDVVNLGDEVIDTPEGEVKVKKFVVSFSQEQIHDFLVGALEVIEKDPVFSERIKSYPVYNFENGEMVEVNQDLPVDQMIEGTRMLIDALIVDEFKLTAYIDIDKYIIHHEYDLKLSFKGILEDVLESFSLKSNYQLFDLHQDQELTFPEINESNTMTIDEVIEKFEDFSIE